MLPVSADIGTSPPRQWELSIRSNRNFSLCRDKGFFCLTRRRTNGKVRDSLQSGKVVQLTGL